MEDLNVVIKHIETQFNDLNTRKQGFISEIENIDKEIFRLQGEYRLAKSLLQEHVDDKEPCNNESKSEVSK